MPTRPGEGGRHTVTIFDHDGYVASRTPFFAKTSFYEEEVERREERFGNIAHAWSRYEGRYAPDGEVVLRGINSVQLYHDGDRWWVLSILWDNERTTTIPLPK